jgi:tRNA threonylcarbamoyladenosine biosynthesis protein TsaE
LDLYRLDLVEETLDLGLDDYFFSDGVCVVEWAEKAMALMPPDHLLIAIEFVSDDERRFKMTPRGRRHEEIVTQLRTLPIRMPESRHGTT